MEVGGIYTKYSYKQAGLEWITLLLELELVCWLKNSLGGRGRVGDQEISRDVDRVNMSRIDT